MHHRSLLKASIVASVATVLALSGCSSNTSPSETPTPVTVPSSPGPGGPSGQASSAAAPASPEPVPSPATTPVPAPSGGDISKTVAPPPGASTISSDFGKTAQPRAGVRVVIDKVESAQVTARGPGEVSGPGVVVRLRVTNESQTALPLTSATVTVTDAGGLPAIGMSGPPAEPLPGEVGAGQEVRGVYVFRLPKASREPLVVRVSLGQTGVPVVVFTGSPS